MVAESYLLDIGNGPNTVKDVHTYLGSNNSDGRPSSFNDLGQVTVRVTFLFNDGTQAAREVRVAGGGFARLLLHKEAAILARDHGTPFSVLVQAATPVVTSMSHYDLYIHGGWGSVAQPGGFTAQLSGL